MSKYEGLPKCQDCGWKLGTELTNNCNCRGHTPEMFRKYAEAFKEARELQFMKIEIKQQTDGRKLWEPAHEADMEVFKHISGGYISVTEDSLPHVEQVAELHGLLVVRNENS